MTSADNFDAKRAFNELLNTDLTQFLDTDVKMFQEEIEEVFSETMLAPPDVWQSFTEEVTNVIWGYLEDNVDFSDVDEFIIDYVEGELFCQLEDYALTNYPIDITVDSAIKLTF